MKPLVGAGEVWDPGHGGEPGAVDGLNPAEGDVIDTREADITLAVALAVRKLRPGIILTREDDRNLTLLERAAVANRAKARLLVSIHCNAAGDPAARGLEVWYHAQSPRGLRLAMALYDELAREFPELRRRGVKSDMTRYRSGFAILRETYCPAALVEWGFVTNPGDERVMAGPGAVERAAAALSRGVDNYLAGKVVA